MSGGFVGGVICGALGANLAWIVAMLIHLRWRR